MRDAADIIKGLCGKNSEGKAPCPNCNKNSLSVRNGTRQPIVVKCWKGCSQEQVIAALRGKGLWSGKAPRTHAPSQADRARLEQATEYEKCQKLRRALAIMRRAAKEPGPDLRQTYFKARGIDVVPACAPLADEPGLVFPVIGYADKGDLKGQLVLKGCQVIYLERHGKKKREARSYGPIKGGYVELAPTSKDQPLVIGEGVETTAAAMEVTGYPGIAGCGSTTAAIRIPPCARVIIAADNDDAGRKLSEGLASRLESEGHKVEIATPPDAGDDWNDVLKREGPDKAAGLFKRSLRKGDPTTVGTAHYVEEFMGLAFPRREMLLAPWLPNPGLAMIFAKRGEAKTFLAMSIAYAVARGEGLLGWECHKPARVLYVDGEMPGALLQERLAMFGKPPRGTISIVSHETFNLRREKMPDLGTEEGRAVLDAIIREVKPDLVVLNSLSTLIRSGEESKGEDWAPVQEWLMKHRWRGRTMLLVHHAGKSGAQRGTSKREDTPETVIRLTKLKDVADKADDESVYRLEFDKGRELFGLSEEPMTLRFAVRDGRVVWSHTAVRNERLELVRQMVADNVPQADIAKELGVSRQAVSKMVQKLNGNVVRLDDYKKPPRA